MNHLLLFLSISVRQVVFDYYGVLFIYFFLVEIVTLPLKKASSMTVMLEVFKALVLSESLALNT